MNIRCTPSHIGGEIKVNNENNSNAFLLCAGAVSEKGVTLKNFKPDEFTYKVLQVLDYMGANVKFGDGFASVSKNRLFGMMANAENEMIFSVYFALAAISEKRFTNIGMMSKLPAEFVNSVVETLTKLRVACSYDDENELVIWSDNDIVGGTADAKNNVYLALAFILISCEAKIPVDILNIGDFESEFPDFISNWNALGGKIEVIK